MLKFDRNSEAPPTFLTSEEALRRRQDLANLFRSEERRAQTRMTRVLEDLDEPSVREALSSLFQGKCAFCETTETTLPYRFRPPSNAQPVAHTDTAHLYYAWLADAWENIYPICKTCLPNPLDAFPVQGRRCELPTQTQLDNFVGNNDGHWRAYPPKERPLLLEPCGREDFSAHLRPRLDGALRGLTFRGSATITHFDLNRSARVHGRREAYERVVDALHLARGEEPGMQGFELGLGGFYFQRMEFGGSCYLLLRRVEKALAALLGGRAVWTCPT